MNMEARRRIMWQGIQMTAWSRAAVTAFLENKEAGKMSYILRRVD